MMEASTKTCRYCGESIKEAAKKCPHCHQWLAKWYIAKPTIDAFQLLLFLGVFFGGFAYIFTQVFPKAQFPDHKKELTIGNAVMNYDTVDGKSRISTVCVIKNSGSITWHDISVEVRYYDASHNLIDALADNRYNVIVPPKGDAAFRIGATALLPKERYASQELEITWAKPKGRF